MKTENTLPSWVIKTLCCPKTHEPLELRDTELVSPSGRVYPIVNGIPVLLDDDSDPTLHVLSASYRRGQGDVSVIDQRAPDLYLESLGVSESQKNDILRMREDSRTIDPVISMLLGATNGNGYLNLIGGESLPIPEWRMQNGNGQILLDIGCNWGRWCHAARGAGWRVIGLDPSLGALSAAKRQAERMGITDIVFICGDARSLPFQNESLNAAHSYSVLQHFSFADATTAVQQVGRVLKTDGLSWIQMAHKVGVRSAYQLARRGFSDGTGFDVRYWTQDQIETVFNSAIGHSEFLVDCYFGLGLQWGDRHMMSGLSRIAVTVSEGLRRTSVQLPWLNKVADSLFIESRKA
ncbi:MAG: methyltransferase domain-containing protein [Myxococcota bacterium]|nr:methyltransferase domain-containing protein [Myxococcota bacterium]